MQVPLFAAVVAITVSVTAAGPPARIVSTARMVAATRAEADPTQPVKAEGNHAGYVFALGRGARLQQRQRDGHLSGGDAPDLRSVPPASRPGRPGRLFLARAATVAPFPGARVGSSPRQPATDMPMTAAYRTEALEPERRRR